MAYKLYGGQLRGLLSASIVEAWEYPSSDKVYFERSRIPQGLSQFSVLETEIEVANESPITCEQKYTVTITARFPWPDDPNERIPDFLERKGEELCEIVCACPNYGPADEFGYPFLDYQQGEVGQMDTRRWCEGIYTFTCTRSVSDDRRPGGGD
jgi:hypothetical protein